MKEQYPWYISIIQAQIFMSPILFMITGSNDDLGYEVERLQIEINMSDGKIEVERGKYTS